MRLLAAAAAAHAALAVRIVQSNDDGWAELNLRALNAALRAAGHRVVLSGPADNMSGSGSRDAPPTRRARPCQYGSCAGGSGPVGANASRPDLHWVNSFPVTAMRYAIDRFGPARWHGAAPDLALSGPNVGPNLWLAEPFSGTVGAAAYAAHVAGVPAVAFSGAVSRPAAWDTSPVPHHSLVYAELAASLAGRLVAAGKPYLPPGVFLNVNFPDVTGACQDPASFRWVLSRVNPAFFSPPDVDWCGSRRLPTELDVFEHAGCYIPVSVAAAADKTTAAAAEQKAVLDKLRDMLACLPR